MKVLARTGIVLALMFGMAMPLVGCEEKEPTMEDRVNQIEDDAEKAGEDAQEEGEDLINKADKQIEGATD